MPDQPIDKTWVRRVDRLPRGSARHGRECDLREVPRRGDDDVRRLLGIVHGAGAAPE